jgi:hypothetical protein
MQTCYGITHDRLAKFYQELRSLGVGPVEGDPYTKALLFLSGLHYAVSYYKAASSGSEFETYYGPAHKNEDGLDASARVVLKRLMRETRTRTTASAFNFRKQQGPLNEEWFRLQIAWISSEALTKGAVQKWLMKIDCESAWLRLCVATGICSLWSQKTDGRIHSMMRKSFPSLIPDLDADQIAQVATCIKSFVRDHRIDLEEQ